MLPGAPKVTVTRKGDSLCQKGCYPMAFVFLFSSSLLQQRIPAVKPTAHPALPCGGGAQQRGAPAPLCGAEPPQGKAPLGAP